MVALGGICDSVVDGKINILFCSVLCKSTGAGSARHVRVGTLKEHSQRGAGATYASGSPGVNKQEGAQLEEQSQRGAGATYTSGSAGVNMQEGALLEEHSQRGAGATHARGSSEEHK